MQNMNSDVMQQWWTHTQLFQQGKDSIIVFGLVLLLMKKRGKWELLHLYTIITNVADQNALQEWPHNIYKAGFVEKQCDSAMKNYSAP